MLGLLSFVAPAAHAQTESPPLDYSRTIEQSGMVFVPYVGMNRGPVYYTSYEQVANGPPTNVSGMRKVIVNLWPTAHRPVTQYNNFISQNAITDAKVLPPATACQPTEEIANLLSYMPAGYTPKILGGNYPMACSLSLFFMSEDEAKVLAIISARPVITLRASIPLCDKASQQLSLTPINQRLVTDGVLQSTSTGLKGNSWDVLFESSRLAQLSPSLFVSSDPQKGWEAYMKAFTLDLNAQTATMSTTTASQPAYICTPDPLTLQFG
ncbi:hypothetical protein D187_002641 [Cystobacter fuscus DSM 2262]|uniref:Uncharacterized protein n=1 Tax=Cystobacter fuscus (strain ATCC 25194 / DSM 2262 / NBRC 100088 / M29) TaxID=1242864 RepID=S9PC83_CYSF2|nr:hypothetical protein D187_002641 [Cystobacter fuscus DSM 2262]